MFQVLKRPQKPHPSGGCTVYMLAVQRADFVNPLIISAAVLIIPMPIPVNHNWHCEINKPPDCCKEVGNLLESWHSCHCSPVEELGTEAPCYENIKALINTACSIKPCSVIQGNYPLPPLTRRWHTEPTAPCVSVW